MDTREQRARSARSQAERAILLLLIATLGFTWCVGLWGVSLTEYDSRLPLIVILGAVTLLSAALGLHTLAQVGAGFAHGPQDTERPPARGQLSPTIQHDLRTPINLILGFCDTILTSTHGYAEPLPSAYRDDVELIQRNARKLQELIEHVLGAAQPEVAPTARPAPSLSAARAPEASEAPAAADRQAKSGVVVLADDTETIELFRQHMTRYPVVGVRHVEEIGHLDPDTVAAVIISDERHHNRIPEIAFLVGDETPILTCSLTSLEKLMAVANTGYLAKPLTLGALSDALLRMGRPVSNILVIDDNRDNVEMLSRMIEALPRPTRLWKAYSGREGLAFLREQPVDLVILDLVLPDMEGLALAQYLRTETNLASIPLLLISSYQETITASPAVLGKIALYELAGFEVPALICHLESLVSQFGPAR